MTATRRDFLLTTGVAAAGVAWARLPTVLWAADDAVNPGWEPGVERRLVSSCLICPARCGLRGRVVDDRLVSIAGNPLHPVNRGGLCPRGVAGVQMLYHPDRLRTPLLRVGQRGGGEWRAIPVEEAVAVLADRLGLLRAAGRPEALAVVAGHCRGSMQELWHQFLTAFGSPHWFTDDYQDGLRAVMAVMHGIPRRPGYDLDRSDLVLSFGTPLFEAWWNPVQAFAAFGGPRDDPGARRGPRLVQVDTRFSRTAARAHEWVGIRPGTWGALALGIAYVLINEELYDADFVARHVTGFEDWVDGTGRLQQGFRSLVARHYRTEEVSAVTGVPVERIVALAKAFGERRPALAVCGSEVLFAPDGLVAGLAIHSLNVLAGNINRPGGIQFGADPPLAPFPEPVLDPIARQGLSRPPRPTTVPPFASGTRAAQLAEAVAAGGEAPEVLCFYYSNPLASAAEPAQWEQVVSDASFVVSFSPFMDETTRQADLVLPDLLAWERWQDAPAPESYPYPVWGIARPLVPAVGAATNSGDLLLAVARTLGGTVEQSLPWDDMEGLLRARAEGLFAVSRGTTFGDAFERGHHRQMEERGWWLRQHEEFDAFWDDLVERGGWTDLFHDETDPAGVARTSDGRIALMPVALIQALEAEGRGRQPYRLDLEAPPTPAEAPDPPDGALRLLPYRVSTLASGTVYLQPWVAEQPTILPDRHWVPWVEVHPATAAARGLGDGTMVWVGSPRGRYRARIRHFPGAPPGAVCAPYGLRHPDGELANPLRLLDGTTDPLTGLPCWFTSMVTLAPA